MNKNQKIPLAIVADILGTSKKVVKKVSKEKSKKIENFIDYITRVFEMSIDCDEWYRKHECVLLSVPQKLSSYMHTLDVLPMTMQMSYNCGYASMLNYMYPQFLETLSKVILLLYEICIEDFATLF